MFYIALSIVSNKEKLLKEVTTMLLLNHPNVMSLIGVCFDGEMPLIIMPYMSNGSVLGYVKQNKGHLLLYSSSQANEEEVCNRFAFKDLFMFIHPLNFTGRSCKKRVSEYVLSD